MRATAAAFGAWGLLTTGSVVVACHLEDKRQLRMARERVEEKEKLRRVARSFPRRR